MYNNFFSFRPRYNELVQILFLSNLGLRLLLIALYYNVLHEWSKLFNFGEHGFYGCTLFFAYNLIYDELKQGGHFHMLDALLFALKLYLSFYRLEPCSSSST